MRESCQIHEVTFRPLGRRGRFKSGWTLQEAARCLGIPIESICLGKGTCLKCKVFVSKGGSKLSEISPLELDKLSLQELEQGYRLACQARIEGDVEVVIPFASVRVEAAIRKWLAQRRYLVRPAVRQYPVDLQSPSLEDPESDLSRLMKRLAETHELRSLTAHYHVLKTLPDRLRESGWQVDVAVRANAEIVRVCPRGRGKLYGLAVDIGTTTVAGYLVDLRKGRICATHGLMNPQVACGEDVMSRIAYTEAKAGGLENLQGLIVKAIDEITLNCVESLHVPADDILEMVVVGNTCMQHLFLGLKPYYIGRSPFTPVLRFPCDLRPRDLGLALEPSANIHTLPMIGGFVGADTVGVLLAMEHGLDRGRQLIVDIGTNGEIVLATEGRLLACSVATGPAFEGAHIRYGMRAAPGAIKRICITPDFNVHWSTIGQKRPQGICGSGIISGVAHLFGRGLLDRLGKFTSPGSNARLRRGPQGTEFVIAWAEETSIGEDIAITQKDIENVQMAKAALYAGAKVLMKRAGVTRPDRVLLAGAFGSVIDPLEAFPIGMFPSCDPEAISSVGNAAGEGAVVALLDVAARRRAVDLAQRVEYIELTVDPSFEHEFAMAMMLPHMRDRFPICEEVPSEIDPAIQGRHRTNPSHDPQGS